MSVLIDGTNTYLATTVTTLTIGTGAYNVATMVCRKGTISAEADLFFIGVDRAATFPNVGLYFSAAGNTLVGTYGSENTVGAYTLTLDTWYWAVMSRAGTGAGQARLRVFDMSGTKVHQTTGTDGGTYSAMDNVWYGESGMGYPTANVEVCNGKVHTGVEWSDEQCVVEMRHFDNQVTGGTDRIAIRLEDTTATYDGRIAIPKAGQSAITLTNSGAVNGASRPTILEPLGLRVRQVAHAPETDGTTGASTRAIAFDANVLAGSVIDAIVGWGADPEDTSGYSVADSLNGSHTHISACYKYNGTHHQTQTAFYFPNSVAGACTVTATFPSSRLYRSVYATEIAGVAVAPLDASASSDVAAATAQTGTAVVATTIGQLVLTSWKDHSNSVIGVSSYQTGVQPLPCLTGDTGIDQAVSFYIRRVAHTFTPTITLGVARDCFIATRTYKPLVVYGTGDSFERTENPLSDGGKWSAAGGGLANLQADGASAIGATASADAVMRRTDTGATGADQWVAAIVGGGSDFSVLVRCDASGNSVGFHCGDRTMYFNAGAFTGITDYGGGYGAWPSGTEVYVELFEALGYSVMAVYQSGVLYHTELITNGPASGGAPGLFVYSNDYSGEARAWAGGGLWDLPGSSGGVSGNPVYAYGPVPALGDGPVPYIFFPA
jgi:hypothetical protein